MECIRLWCMIPSNMVSVKVVSIRWCVQRISSWKCWQFQEVTHKHNSNLIVYVITIVVSFIQFVCVCVFVFACVKIIWKSQPFAKVFTFNLSLNFRIMTKLKLFTNFFFYVFLLTFNFKKNTKIPVNCFLLLLVHCKFSY